MPRVSRKVHQPLQRDLKCLTDRQAALLQGGPVNCSLLVVVSVAKQLLLHAQQLRSEFSTGARAFGDGDQIAYQVRPAQLSLLQGEMVACREAIAHHNPAKVLPSSSTAVAVDRLRPWMNIVTRR